MNFKLSFFSHYKSYMTIWPNPLPSIWRYSDGLSKPLPKRHVIFERSLTKGWDKPVKCLDQRSERADLYSHYPFSKLNVKQGSCEYQLLKSSDYEADGVTTDHALVCYPAFAITTSFGSSLFAETYKSKQLC